MEENKTNSGITNVKLYPQNIQRMKSLIIEGTNFNYKQGEVAEAELADGMHIASTIGSKRETQEDAVLLVVHPENPEFKMLAVADGVGGYEQGEEASKMIVNEMRDWFVSLKQEQYYQSPEEIQNIWTEKLNQVNYQVIDVLSKSLAASTFCGAIILENQTVVANVGDSRAYIINGKNLKQITRDQSASWEKYERGEIEEKDDIRFDNEINCIIQAIGGIRIPLKIDYSIADNDSYDILFLVTDGVTDILSDKRLMAICSKTNRKELARRIIEASQDEKESEKQFEDIEEFEDDFEEDWNVATIPGKDNATIAVLDKREDEEER